MGVVNSNNNNNNSIGHQANDVTADGDAMPNTADMTDNADVANAIDANVFETITQVRAGGFLDSDSVVPSREQSLSAESESPPESPPNPVEQPSSPDARSQVVIEHYRCGKPGAPINGMQSSSENESSQEAHGGSVWVPFRSECDWNLAHWAKMNGPSATALTGLLAIPNVRLSFFFILLPLLNVVQVRREARPLISYCQRTQFDHRQFAWPPTFQVPRCSHWE
jgi:hypothetical protein